MKWYHYTGYEQFLQIINDGYLLSHYQKLLRYSQGNEHIESLLFELMNAGDSESIRKTYVFLTSGAPKTEAHRETEIILGFELNDTLTNSSGILKVKELSLDYLVDVATAETYFVPAGTILTRVQSGKYSKVKLYLLT